MSASSSPVKVTMYAKATCPYCIRAEMLLVGKGVATLEKIRIDFEPERREEMITRSGRYTVPQIFIGERHVGGCDDLYALDDTGQLDQMLGAVTVS